MAATRPRRAAGTVSYREYEEHEVFREDAKDGKGKAESERASKRPERQRIKKSPARRRVSRTVDLEGVSCVCQPGLN